MAEFKVKVNSSKKDEIHAQLKPLPLLQKLITELILWADIPAEYTIGETVIKTEEREMKITSIKNTKCKLEIDGNEINSGRDANDFRNIVIKELVKMGFRENVLL